MRLVTFADANAAAAPRLGALDGDAVADLSAAFPGPMLDLVRAGPAALDALRAALLDAPRRPLAAVRLEAPLRPGKVLCSGVNYRGHAEENPNAKMPEEPFFFAKLPNAIVGPEAPISCGASRQVDYEVEFAVVIGGRLSRAAPGEVMPAIFGYTMLHDVSARDIQFRDAQITLGKNLDGFGPLGPCVVTADALPRPDRVALRTRLNGRTMQDGSTADWLFPLPVLISFLSRTMTLEPGDVVSTGTPAGVGLFRDPQVFLKPGDLVEIEAEGVGVLRNPVVA
jgi:2-keto-4-pentenoate hydratase/2-oxohepta-3-ene-1,7-dioic acid hydratase in catechol pathway